ncbi:MAG: hypothetical protein IKM48_03310 [Clostridia bacterium]|nr:hypothetical protein [Clostridia bacterium]
MPSIVVERDHGCYIVYVNGEFWSTCESMAEVAEEMADIRDRYKVEA